MIFLSRRSVLWGASLLGAPPALAQNPSLVLRGREGWLFSAWDDPTRMETGASVSRVLTLMGETAKLLRAKGVEVGFLVIPAKTRVYRDMLPTGDPFPPEAEERYARMLAALRAEASLVPDLLAAFHAHRRAHPADQLFFKSDTHWTPLGASVAATVTSQAVQAAVRLPAGRGAARLGPPITETRLRRDLVDFLPPPDRAAHPPERYVIRKPVAAGDRNALLDDRASDVALVGNSFMAPEFNFTPELSAALSRAVALHWRVQTHGPFGTLLEYLRSPLFAREKPRVLLISVTENALALNPENRGAYPEHAMRGDAYLDGLRQTLTRV